jgi:hypothetical protein
MTNSFFRTLDPDPIVAKISRHCEHPVTFEIGYRQFNRDVARISALRDTEVAKFVNAYKQGDTAIEWQSLSDEVEAVKSSPLV